MDNCGIELTHNELSLLLFALEGGPAAPMPNPSSCEEACPVVESVEELLCGGQLDPRQQLIRHLNNHLRQGLIECGAFELMAAANSGTQRAIEDSSSARQVNQRLAAWSCQVNLSDDEKRTLVDALGRLPRSSWITMPVTLWRVRRRLKRS